MNSDLLKKTIPHLVALLIFTILSFGYFNPVLEGKRLTQHDGVTYKGMSKEISDYRAETGEEALWTNSMFGGMPAYLISVIYPNNYVKYTGKFLEGFPRPVSMLFIYLVGFYLLMLAFDIRKWLAIVGAVAMAFSSYYLVIIAAGHNSKAIAIAYLPWVIAGVYMVFRGKKMWGVIIFSIGLALEMLAGHPQITYYGLLLLLIFGIVELIYAIREKKIVDFAKSVAILILPAVIAIGTDIGKLMLTIEYGNYSIRGKSELTFDKENKTSGLDKDYATAWSYGRGETFTLLIPNYKGGSSTAGFDTDSESYKELRSKGVAGAKNIVKQLPGYWGDQPGTSGPVYVGALICFLFVLGLFIIKGPVKWWLLSATVLSILLAWGKHFMPLTDFFLDHFPMYNKFRTVSMILVIAEIAIPLLGMLALKEILSGGVDKKELKKALIRSGAIVGGFCLLVAMIPGISGSFSGPVDAQLPEWLLGAIRSDRASLLKVDAMRSFAFIALGALAIWLFLMDKIKANMVIIGIGLLVLIDLWGVNKRYLNNDQFVSKKQVEEPFKLAKSDIEILKDKDLSYRVLNLNNPFNDARTSYFHKSIGGYHGAKMRRYQELIDYRITEDMRAIFAGFQNPASLDSVMSSLHVLNMLNTKYLVYKEDAPPLNNQYALGNAWLVKSVKMVNSANEEIESLAKVDTGDEVVVNNKFKSQLTKDQYSGEGSVALTDYKPNYLKYEFNGADNQLVVFSEIYYPKGWNAYIDGKKSEYFQADYVLRAMEVPAGKHTIEFKFEPSKFSTGNTIALLCSLILLLAVVGAIVYGIRQSLATEDEK
ncbi:hypothetical protein EYV94_24285 [Puteibacter caeruleilacunae]|nr:hypothetical protein EYV94_24285 [Puteibacter caeruleilacunae]